MADMKVSFTCFMVDFKSSDASTLVSKHAIDLTGHALESKQVQPDVVLFSASISALEAAGQPKMISRSSRLIF